jgi:hypothetical protein
MGMRKILWINTAIVFGLFVVLMVAGCAAQDVPGISFKGEKVKVDLSIPSPSQEVVPLAIGRHGIRCAYTSQPCVDAYWGTDLTGYSDAGTTVKWSIETSGGHLYMAGHTTATGPVTMFNTLKLSGTLANANGVITIADGLSVTVGITSAGHVSVMNGLNVSGGLTIDKGGLFATDGLTVTAGGLVVSSGEITAYGSISAAGAITTQDSFSTAGTLGSAGRVTIDSDGLVVSAGFITVADGITTGGGITAQSSISSGGSLSVANGASIQAGGLSIAAGSVSLPSASVANSALASPKNYIMLDHGYSGGFTNQTEQQVTWWELPAASRGITATASAGGVTGRLTVTLWVEGTQEPCQINVDSSRVVTGCTSAWFTPTIAANNSITVGFTAASSDYITNPFVSLLVTTTHTN